MAIIQNFAAKDKGITVPKQTPDNIDQIGTQFSRSIEGVAGCFGAMMGIAKWHRDYLKKAMEQLKGEGCKYCNHKKCEKCLNKSGWAWDMGERYES